jgi:hypothetical protein
MGHLRKYVEMPSQIEVMKAEISSLSSQLRSAEESLRKAITDSVQNSSELRTVISSLSSQLRSAEESLRKAISDSVQNSSDSAHNRAIESPMRRRLVAVVVLIGLICSGVIAYSAYQISSAQGNVATDQHHDQQATEFLAISVQEGLLGHFQQSDDFYKAATQVFTLDGPLITHYENVEAQYSLPLIISTAFIGALLGWALTEMLRARHRKGRSGAEAGTPA